MKYYMLYNSGNGIIKIVLNFIFRQFPQSKF
jgi:hypothetical protein